MPERARHHHRSDAYAEYSRERDSAYYGDPSPYDDRGRNQKPRDVGERGPAGDRRAKHDRHRDLTTDNDKSTHRNMAFFLEKIDTSFQLNIHIAVVFIPCLPGLCQLMELFVNLLLVICAGVPYSNNGGYRDLASLGGVYYYHFGGANAFTGADADRVKELDRLFHQLKRPPYVFTMACGGLLMTYACVMLALGIFRVPYRWPPVLLGELQETYNNPICDEREQMYKSKGHKGFDCQLHGADIAGGLFGVMGVFVFISGTVLAVRAFRSVRELKGQRISEDNNF
uniref:MARVEL domain containing 3 n=1 Tax=Scophthalmus maximus TaxID=52904 RepID=A0A8D3CVE3_SCOMX